MIKSEPPMAPAGCPEFAFSTIDAARIRMLSAALFINFLSFIIFSIKFDDFRVISNNLKLSYLLHAKIVKSYDKTKEKDV